ncbi:hypothetical protein BCR39DRAFT_582790 [Naematelia encephala]|uniref:Uncharacterized protein n=1 Tax=Naematelia encephala TaxID=71784 RepID=A0A1Y2AN16_9TREE|nr:hypothetical protein BCR39DRAFT_582790 [Naematelia encephala]
MDSGRNEASERRRVQVLLRISSSVLHAIKDLHAFPGFQRRVDQTNPNSKAWRGWRHFCSSPISATSRLSTPLLLLGPPNEMDNQFYTRGSQGCRDDDSHDEFWTGINEFQPQPISSSSSLQFGEGSFDHYPPQSNSTQLSLPLPSIPYNEHDQIPDGASSLMRLAPGYQDDHSAWSSQGSNNPYAPRHWSPPSYFDDRYSDLSLRTSQSTEPRAMTAYPATSQHIFPWGLPPGQIRPDFPPSSRYQPVPHTFSSQHSDSGVASQASTSTSTGPVRTSHSRQNAHHPFRTISRPNLHTKSFETNPQSATQITLPSSPLPNPSYQDPRQNIPPLYGSHQCGDYSDLTLTETMPGATSQLVGPAVSAPSTTSSSVPQSDSDPYQMHRIHLQHASSSTNKKFPLTVRERLDTSVLVKCSVADCFQSIFLSERRDGEDYVCSLEHFQRITNCADLVLTKSSHLTTKSSDIVKKASNISFMCMACGTFLPGLVSRAFSANVTCRFLSVSSGSSSLHYSVCPYHDLNKDMMKELVKRATEDFWGEKHDPRSELVESTEEQSNPFDTIQPFTSISSPAVLQDSNMKYDMFRDHVRLIGTSQCKRYIKNFHSSVRLRANYHQLHNCSAMGCIQKIFSKPLGGIAAYACTATYACSVDHFKKVANLTNSELTVTTSSHLTLEAQRTVREAQSSQRIGLMCMACGTLRPGCTSRAFVMNGNTLVSKEGYWICDYHDPTISEALVRRAITDFWGEKGYPRSELMESTEETGS